MKIDSNLLKTNGAHILMESNKMVIYVVGFIYDDWGDTDADDLLVRINETNATEIHCFINSEGGSVFHGVELYNSLRLASNRGIKVITNVVGIAASAASLPALAGDERNIGEGAMIMIHAASTIEWGTAKKLRDTAERLDKIMESVKGIYLSRTKVSDTELDEMLETDTYLSANACIALGFSDSKLDLDNDLLLDEDGNKPLLPAVENSIKKNKLLSSFITKRKNTMDDFDDPNKKQSSNKNNLNTEQQQQQQQQQQDNVVEMGMKKEQNRKEAIATLFKNEPDKLGLFNECIMDANCTVEMAQSKLLQLYQNKSHESLNSFHAEVLETEVEKMGKGFTRALMIRSGLEKREKDENNEFLSFSLKEMARLYLNKIGDKKNYADVRTMVGQSFVSMHNGADDFPNILSNVASKAMLLGYEEAGETFELWTTPGVLTDFKISERADLNSFPNLDKIDGGEYKYAVLSDRKVQISLATYGKIFSIRREAIINDDLESFTKVPRLMGRAAHRTVGNLVYNELTSGTFSGTALFHADHNNLGSAAAISATTIDAMRSLLRKQTDASSNAHALNIPPGFLIVPSSLEGKAISIIESEVEVSGSKNLTNANPVRNIAQVISDARLDADSITAHYLTANGKLYDTIEVAYLNGDNQPFIDESQQWNKDGIELKVRHDAGIKIRDFRTMAKNAGA